MSNFDPPKIGSAFYDLEKPSNEKFLAWFAGFLEADGHASNGYVTLDRNAHRIKVTQAGDKGKRECKMIKRQFGDAGWIQHEKAENMEMANKDQYSWWMTEPNAIKKILQWIQPYLDPHTKLSDELDYYGVNETVPVWQQNEHYKQDELRTMLVNGIASHNAIKNQYFPEHVAVDGDLELAKPWEEMKVEFNKHYDGDKTFEEAISVIRDDLVDAIGDINVKVDHSIEMITLEGFDSVDATIIKLTGESEPGYIPVSFNRNTELDVEARWNRKVTV